MKRLYVVAIAAACLLAACSSHQNSEQDHSADAHDHHGELGQKLIQYTDTYELYAEAAPFVVGQTTAVLAHFTCLADFKPLQDAAVSASLNVGGQTVEAKAEAVSPGIYRLPVKAIKAGEGVLTFHITTGNDANELLVPVKVFADEHDAHHSLEEEEAPSTAVGFTKEQSWKIDFATALPQHKPFGQLIKATARVEALPAQTHTLTAQTSGVVQFVSAGIVAGSTVSAGQQLFTISGTGMGDDNAALVYQTAEGDYELAKAGYDRMKQLADKQIVSQKEFLQSQNSFEKAKAKYENLKQNFNTEGQSVRASKTGVLEKVWVKNGQHVAAGEPLATLASYGKVQLVAGVQQKYSALLSKISSVAFYCSNPGWRNLDELNGKLLSVGKRAQDNNFLLPVYFEADNSGEFIPGSYVELNMTTASEKEEVVVPVSALVEQQGNFFVFVQLNPELFEKRQVVPGSSNGYETAIAKGLNADERIVTKGAVMLKLASASSTLDPHAGHVH
ncbi:efflux RND transporter periplasmic adaptor subunit [Mangrovibacterium lignilyticum]|uniref:efflux RND transporter periplasmic adaptor subunit n=1 Tax=Mangrovibacterium lignilyticum TaxID=2668052 RepID=UPI0013D00D0D|nr:efflux RND transporter periplasmic adaptor subunit [Mangrovibacterium lignilyticum]